MNQKRVQFFSAGAVTPPTPVDVESITLSESSLELVEGQKSAKLTVTYAPANANQGKSVTWASSDEAVATVADGVVTAVAVGTATITATTPNGKSASCAVTVKEKPAPSGNLATSLAVGDVVVMINSDASKEFNGISGTYGAAEDYSGDPAGLHPLTIVAGSADGSIAFQDGDAYLAWTSGNSLTTASEVDASSSWVVTFESNDATIANVGTPERILSYNAGSPRFACYGNMNQKRVQFFSAGAVTPVAKITANPASVSFNVTLEDNIAQAEQAVEIKAQNIANEISISIQGAPEITVEPNQLAKDGGIITVKLNASEEGEYSSKITLSAKNDEGADVVATIEVSAKVKEKATPVTGEGFIKVTEALNDWSGTYLIVYEEGSLAFNGAGTDAGDEVKLDAANNYIEVTITGGAIAANEDTKSASFTIAKMDGGYSIKAANGNFIGQTADQNGLTEKAEAIPNTISLDDEGSALIAGAAGAVLRFNTASNQMRFRYYKAASYANQKAIHLFKLKADATALENVEPAELDLNTPMYNIVGQRVDASYQGIIIQKGHKFLIVR